MKEKDQRIARKCEEEGPEDSEAWKVKEWQ